MSRHGMTVTILLVVAASVTGYLFQQLRVERAARAGLQDQVSALQLALQAAQSAAVPASAMAPPVGNLPAPAASTIEPPVTRPAFTPPPFELDPRKMIYPEFSSDLGLPASQAEALTKSLQQSAPDAEILALLGPKYTEFKAFMDAPDAGRMTDDLRRMLAMTDHPLTDEQARQLVPSIVAEVGRVKGEIVPPGDMSDPRAQMRFLEDLAQAHQASSARIIEAARGYLDPQQVFALQSLYGRQLGSERQRLDMRRAQQQGGTRGAVQNGQ